MKAHIIRTLFVGFTLLCLTGKIMAQAGTSPVKAKEAFEISTLTRTGLPFGSQNYLLSPTIKEMQNHTYILTTDSNGIVAYIVINGLTERLTALSNGEHVPVYVNQEYTVVINKKPATDQGSKEVTAMSDKDDWKYMPLEGSLTISDKKGSVVIKKFIGAQLNALKK